MAEPEERFTRPGTKLPPLEGLPPTLLFHRWQRYDCFWPDSFIDDRNKVQKLTPFKRDFTGLSFLERVAKEVHRLTHEEYAAWYQRFADAFIDLQIEPVVRATTLWRLVVGWGTNPAFETGITLDHLLGFPVIPGSAVKGLLHRVAEQELLDSVGDEPPIPVLPEELPQGPTDELQRSLTRALRVRALFGSIHLRKNKKPRTDPEAPFDRLHEWHRRLSQPGEDPDLWSAVRKQLARLCSDAPAGGMVTCFDAVPALSFLSEDRRLLTPDVLTPHGGPSPTPILFLAVRDGVAFELRYRLSAWPAAEPRDPAETERAADLGAIQREIVALDLKRWLVRGLAELGLGGKTSAGYGYLLAAGARLAPPKLRDEPALPVEPKEILSDAERAARAALPDDIDASRAVDALDKALKEPDPAVQAAVAARFKRLFPEALEKWRTSQRPATRRRVEAVDRLLGGENKP